MISFVKVPKSKQELLAAIQRLRKPEIDVVEALSAEDRKEVLKRFDAQMKHGAVSVIMIREKGR